MRGLFVFVLAAGSSVSFAQNAQSLIHEGSPVGDAGQVVTANGIVAIAANDIGGYIVSINTTDGTTAQTSFWGDVSGGPGQVLRTRGTVSGYTQTGWETFFGFSNTGDIAYSPTLTGSLDSVWINDTPLAVEGIEIEAGGFWSFASRPTVTSNGIPFWVTGTRTTASGSTSNRGLYSGLMPVSLLSGGDPLGGISEPVSPLSSVQFSFKVSSRGTNWVGLVGITAPAASDRVVAINGDVVVVDGSPVREGVLVPVSAGGDGVEAWTNWSDFGINEAGDWLMTGDTNAATTQDHFVAINGQIILREGEVASGLNTSGAFSGADLNESGDWAVLWGVSVDGTTREAVIFNGEVLIKETDEIDFDGDGLPDAGITLTDITGLESLFISDRRAGGFVDVFFTGDTALGEAAYRISVPVPCPADLNGDGGVDGDDVIAFFALWDVSDSGADFNGDGGVDGDDVIAFFGRWDNGC